MRAGIYRLIAGFVLAISLLVPALSQAHSVTLWKTHDVLRHKALSSAEAAKKKAAAPTSLPQTQPKTDVKH